STKPLAAATRRLERSRQALDDANRAHQERLALLEQLSGRRQELAELSHRLDALETAERLALASAHDEKRTAAAAEVEMLKAELKPLAAAADRQRAVLEGVATSPRAAEARVLLDQASAHHADLRPLQEDAASKDTPLQNYDRDEHVLLGARRLLELTSRR